MTDAQVTQEISSYVNNFIDNRFPNGLNGDMREIVAQIVLDSFQDGAKWAELQLTEPEPSKIILPGE